MQRRNDGDVQRRGLLEHVLHLHAVLAHDADVVAAGLRHPVLLNVQRAELAEAVGREQYLLAALVAEHDLRPVDHRRKDEVQLVRAQAQRAAVGSRQRAAGQVEPFKELAHHGQRLRRGDNGGLRVNFQEFGNVGRVVGLHVVDDEIVRLAAVQRGGDIAQPFVREVRVDSVEHGGFFVQNDVGVVRHAARHLVLAFKQVNGVVVDADVADVFGNIVHGGSLHFVFGAARAAAHTPIVYHTRGRRDNVFLRGWGRTEGGENEELGMRN